MITVDRYGNTASTTHTVALVEELEAGRIRAGETDRADRACIGSWRSASYSDPGRGAGEPLWAQSLIDWVSRRAAGAPATAHCSSRSRRPRHACNGHGRDADDVDLLVNAGIYRDRNLAEPALAALIQEDIGANPEDPHGDRHGTFSFDIANGTCGVLTGLQIVDGFLRSHTIRCALITASDADPGRGMSEHFPFSPCRCGAAVQVDR